MLILWCWVHSKLMDDLFSSIFWCVYMRLGGFIPKRYLLSAIYTWPLRWKQSKMYGSSEKENWLFLSALHAWPLRWKQSKMHGSSEKENWLFLCTESRKYPQVFSALPSNWPPKSFISCHMIGHYYVYQWPWMTYKLFYFLALIKNYMNHNSFSNVTVILFKFWWCQTASKTCQMDSLKWSFL